MLSDNAVILHLDSTSFGLEPISFLEVCQRFSEFERLDTIGVLSRLSILVSLGELDDKGQEWILNSLIHPDVQAEGRRRGAFARPYAVLTRVQVLRAWTLLLAFGEGGSRRLENDADRFYFGETLLHLEKFDQELGRGGEHDEDVPVGLNPIEVPSQVLLTFMQSRLDEGTLMDKFEIVRGFLLLNRHLPDELGDKWAAAVSRFEAKFGASIGEMWFFCYALYTLVLGLNKDNFGTRSVEVNLKEFSGKLKWSKETKERVFHRLTAQATDIRANFYRRGLGAPDWSLEHPLVEEQGRHYLFDARALLRLIGGDIFDWVCSEQLPYQREQFKNKLGDAFEAHCRFFAEEACLTSFSAPTFKRGSPQDDIDFRVFDSNVTILFEIKNQGPRFPNLGQLTPQARSNQLNSRGNAWRKGVAQLAKASAKWLDSRAHNDRCYAVLVLNDESFADFGLQEFMNRAFIDGIKLTHDEATSKHLRRLIVLTLSEFEFLFGLVAEGKRLADILDAAVAEDQRGSASFLLSMNKRGYSSNGNQTFLASSFDELTEFARQHLED